ncbi:MAG: hypothetical protein MUE85_01610 [Microscillaceae bacterium]|jgi:tetratricopeptide (TPR) repeat protein|nr:hypothetical protein [Microscillaceae bacterium]
MIYKKSNFYLPFYYCLVGLVVGLVGACKSTDKIFGRANELAQQGKPCEAVQELKSVKVNRKTDNQQIEALINTVNDFGQQCIAQYMGQARQIGSQARTRQEFEKAYAECSLAKGLSEQMVSSFQSKLNNQAANWRVWQSGDEAYLLDMFEAVTEAMYQEAVDTYQAGQLENAYDKFKLVEARQTDYKESINYIQVIKENLAEQYYQRGQQLFAEAQHFQEAYDNFKNALHWVENYKNADSLSHICYDKVTDQYFETAQQTKLAYKFRGAFRYFKLVLDRGGLQRYPALQEEMEDCIRLGKVKIFVETSDDEFGQLLQKDIRTQINDPFMQLVGSYPDANYRVLPDFRYQVSNQNAQRNRRVAYRIKSYETEQRQDSNTVVKVRKYFAEDEVVYEEVEERKTATCRATYSFRGKGNLSPNRPPRSFKGEANDQVSYNELTSNVNLNDLTLQKLAYNPQTNPSYRPSVDTQWRSLFAKSRAIKTDTELAREAKYQIQTDLMKAILEDLRDMLQKIE